MLFRLAGEIKHSLVNGPGIRYVVFFQGCPHHCEGCHNPETHDPAGGYISQPENILNILKFDFRIRCLQELLPGFPVELLLYRFMQRLIIIAVQSMFAVHDI